MVYDLFDRDENKASREQFNVFWMTNGTKQGKNGSKYECVMWEYWITAACHPKHIFTSFDVVFGLFRQNRLHLLDLIDGATLKKTLANTKQ